jgi:hypothetical protein
MGSELATTGVTEDAHLNPLEDFLVRCSSPLPSALLPNPSDAPATATTKKSAPEGAENIKRSGRLAAKPIAGWSAMDKVKFVLLRKSGITNGGEAPSKNDLQKYTSLYKKPLTQQFIEAGNSLMDATSPNKKKDLGAEDKLAAALAV